MTKSKISLKNRFWMIFLGLLTVMGLFFGVVISNLLSPQAARVVVRMDEENRLFRLSRLITESAPTDLEDYWKVNREPNTTIEKQDQVREGAISVAIPGSNYALVSLRPATMALSLIHI